MGWPDWSKVVRPGKSMFLEGQIPWGHWFVGDIPASSSVEALDFTVPAIYYYHLTLALVSNDWDGMQQVSFTIDPGEDSDFFFREHFALPLHPASGMLVIGGTRVRVTVFNKDSAEHAFTGNILGILQQVA